MTINDMLDKFVETYEIEQFKVGMRVQVQNQNSYKSKKIANNLRYACGTVSSVDRLYGKIAVRIDDMVNELSAAGVFYFKPRELTIAHDDKIIMEEKTMATNVSNITNYLNAIKIKYVGDVNPCSYIFASFEPELKVGDLVVVKPAHHNIALARVEEILEGTNYETTREVISKVDTSAYNERVKVRNKAAELKAEMEKRAKQLQDIALYQMLAKDDPALMELLNQYQALTKAYFIF